MKGTLLTTNHYYRVQHETVEVELLRGAVGLLVKSTVKANVGKLVSAEGGYL